MSNKDNLKVGIHQPNFFPWIGFFDKLRKSDIFIILDTVDIELGSAKSITHRVKIKSSNGGKWLTLPIQKGGSKLIKDILLDDKAGWREKLINQVREYYRKAPYFNDYFPFVSECINDEEKKLAEYNTNIIKKIATQLNISTTIVKASELNCDELDRNKRIIQLVQEVGGKTYLSGKGGAKYHDDELFKNSDINIEYLNFQHPVYNQLYDGDFIPGLSIMDYLFNNKENLWK